MGERDIEGKVLDLPIPIFNGNNRAHIKLAELGIKASDQGSKIDPIIYSKKQLGLKRKIIRDEIEAVLGQIDEYVGEIFKI